jgi:exodeoxyribonuclease VII large subunit
LADRAAKTEAEGATNVAEFSVSELAGAIKRALEDGFGYVRLRGEVSGYRGPHASGHCYFALKDDKAKIDAVVWRGVFSRLKVRPEEGMEVIAQGKVTSYPNASKYQIVIESLEPAGVGALMALLEERKRKFAAEGLFDDSRKRPIPFLPRLIGIVTSPTGAVIRDMMAGFTERFPARVMVWPVRVQGETSAAEVAAAIRGFNAMTAEGRFGRPDTLIVARGGGSLEDLWGFNEEAVVRAVAESDIPVISAVGHETDWTLIDLVADARAPTPTKAAEWAVPMFGELVADIEDRHTRLKHGARRMLEGKRTQLKAAARGLPRLEDILTLPRQRFDAVEQRLGRALIANTSVHARRLAQVAPRLQPQALRNRIARGRDQLDARVTRLERAILTRVSTERRGLNGLGSLLRSLSYQSVLDRGFALVRDGAGEAVRKAAGLSAGDAVTLQFGDGTRDAQIVSGSEGDSAIGQAPGEAEACTLEGTRKTARRAGRAHRREVASAKIRPGRQGRTGLVVLIWDRAMTSAIMPRGRKKPITVTIFARTVWPIETLTFWARLWSLPLHHLEDAQ